MTVRMKKGKYNLPVLCLCLVLIVSLLSGCGMHEETVRQTATPSPTAQSSSTPAPQDGSWEAKFIPIQNDGSFGKLENITVQNDAVYFTSVGVLEDRTPAGVTPEWPEQYWVYGPVLVEADFEGNTHIIPYVSQPTQADEGENSGVLFEKLYADPDGSIWVLENHYTVNEETSELNTVEKNLVHLTVDGTVLQNFPLLHLAQHREDAQGKTGTYSFDVAGIVTDETGHVYMGIHEWFSGNGTYNAADQLCVLDAVSGERTHSIALYGETAGLARLSDGSIVVASYSGSSPVIGLVDLKSETIQEIATLYDFLDGMAGSPAGTQLYYSAGDSVSRLDTGVEESEEKLFAWTACDVAHDDSDGLCVRSDGSVVTFVTEETGAAVHQELVILSPSGTVGSGEKKVLTMAVLHLYPYTAEVVSRFNRSNPDYRIEVTDYDQYNVYGTGNPEDWNIGLSRLQTELIAGNIPDILDISLLPVSRLGEKGILQDLMPYIDADPELGRDQLNMHVLESFEQNGMLYQTVSNFYVLTAAGLTDVVGPQMGWRMADCSEAFASLRAQHPDATIYDVSNTRNDALNFELYLELENYVDWNKGKCGFDSASFKDILAFIKSFPASYDWSALSGADVSQDARLLAGTQLMKECTFSCFEDTQIHTIGLGGRDLTFVGYPTENGVGSMFAQMGNSFAICRNCADADAAWQFVREFFLPAYQEQFKGFSFPTNLKVYEEMKQEAMSVQYQRNPDGSFTLDADGKRIEADRGSVDYEGAAVKLRAVNAEEVAIIEQIIASTTHVLATDDSLKEIIATGAEGYFADQRSVDEAASQIQQRAEMYVNEQR